MLMQHSQRTRLRTPEGQDLSGARTAQWIVNELDTVDTASRAGSVSFGHEVQVVDATAVRPEAGAKKGNIGDLCVPHGAGPDRRLLPSSSSGATGARDGAYASELCTFRCMTARADAPASMKSKFEDKLDSPTCRSCVNALQLFDICHLGKQIAALSSAWS
jgi:hypothetical protein